MPVDLSFWTSVPLSKWQSATPGGTYSLLQQVFAHVLGAAKLLTSNSILKTLSCDVFYFIRSIVADKLLCLSNWMDIVQPSGWYEFIDRSCNVLICCCLWPVHSVYVSPLSFCELFDECSSGAFWLVQLLGFIKSSTNNKMALVTLSLGWNEQMKCMLFL